jgi:putative FmdB family regulatory protein
MPVYVYHCDKCLRQFERFQHYTDDPLTVCPECGEPTLQKVYQVTNVHYKGDGFYVTDKDKPEK